MTHCHSKFAVVASLIATLGLAACSPGAVRPVGDNEYNNMQDQQGGNIGKVGGGDGLVLGVGKNGKSGSQQDGAVLGVNAYLWRAALDTLSFMPLVSADPFGGVIITDWYQPPQAPDERLKATAYILGRQLRTDGIRISVFRQVRQDGQWISAPVATSVTGELEDKVLARARELRSQATSSR